MRYSFATLDDYEVRHGEVPQAATTTVQVRLEDATAKIVAALESAGVNWRRRISSPTYATLLAAVTCDMTHRAVQAILPGIKSRQQSAGPYSFTDTLANPMGDLYLLASEKKTLGIGRARVTSLQAMIHGR